MNKVILQGTLIEKQPLRYTPAGFPVFEGMIHHRTQVVESERERIIEYDVPLIAIGKIALKSDELSLGSELMIQGFLAPRSIKSQRLIVHITDYI